MNLDVLAEQYRAKTDEELLQLAGQLGQLTMQAQSILKGELSRRHLDIPRANIPPQQETVRTATRQNPEAMKVQGIREFMPAVLTLYRSHMWLFVKLTAPPVAFTTLALLIGRHVVHEIARQLLRTGGSLTQQPRLFLEATLVGITRNLVSWCAFCLSFAIICAVVDQVESGYAASISESFQAIRQRLGSFLRLCLLLAVIFFVIDAIASLTMMAVVWILDQFHTHPTGLANSAIVYACGALGLLVLSRFALAIPAFVLDDLQVGKSIFKSDELMQGKWLYSSILLTKSLVGGYVAAMFPFWLARWLPLGDIEFSSWFPWFLTSVSVVAVTLVEPVMFIGFSLLYVQATASEMASVQTSAATE